MAENFEEIAQPFEERQIEEEQIDDANRAAIEQFKIVPSPVLM